MDGNQEQSSNLSTVKHDQSSSVSHKNEKLTNLAVSFHSFEATEKNSSKSEFKHY